MQKPEHSAWCQPAQRPSPSCPCCAWKEAVEATLVAVRPRLELLDETSQEGDYEALLDAVREQVK